MLFRSEKASVLEHFQELYRQGRPGPIDREVLEASGAVSPTFIDAVSQKLDKLNNRPDSLLRALRNGEVPRFKSTKADELEEYLYNEGYLKDEKPLAKEDILVRIQARLSNTNLTRDEAQGLIDKLQQGA